MNKVEERKINRLRDEFGSAIRHKNFDPWYEQDSWEQNYSIIDHFLGDIEENINECIHRSTMPSIEYNLFLYRQIIWNIVYNSVFQSISELPKQPLDTVLSSIHRVFVDCITSSEIPEDRKSQIVLKISEFIYTLSNNIKEEFGEVTGYKKNKDLLRKFKEDAEIHDPESAKEIEQLLRELE